MERVADIRITTMKQEKKYISKVIFAWNETNEKKIKIQSTLGTLVLNCEKWSRRIGAGYSDHISSHMDQVAGAKIFWIPVSDKFKVQMRCEAALKASSAADTQGSRNRGRRGGGGGGTAVKHFLTQEREKKPSNIKATPVSICTNFSYLHWRLFFSSKLFQLRVFAGGGGLRTVPGVEIPVN